MMRAPPIRCRRLQISLLIVLTVEANFAALESTRASYDEGVKVLLDVLNAQQDYFRSQREYKTARYEYMVLIARFENAIGIEDVFR